MSHDHDHDHGGECSEADAIEEREHFERVIGSFVGYEAVARADQERTRRACARLNPRLEALLPKGSLEARIDALGVSAAANGEFLRAVVQNQGNFGPMDAASTAEISSTTGKEFVDSRSRNSRPREADFSKVRSTLHSIVRDWSEEGAEERRQCFDPIVDELRRVLPVVNGFNRNRQRVLVPGAGLARLVLEICAAGYAAQGNEFSYHMLLVSNYILNSRLEPRGIKIHPFIDQPSNCVASADRTRVVEIPDVSPDELLYRYSPAPQQNEPGETGDAPLDFSMAAGEFVEVYKEQSGCWEGVATCFFVDTAPVALEYVEAIWRLLKPGGSWVNLGPLLYHWVPSSSSELLDEQGGFDDRYNQSIEFSWEELRYALIKQGFKLVNEERRSCHYTANSRSMMRTQYECIFFTATKPDDTKSNMPPAPN